MLDTSKRPPSVERSTLALRTRSARRHLRQTRSLPASVASAERVRLLTLGDSCVSHSDSFCRVQVWIRGQPGRSMCGDRFDLLYWRPLCSNPVWRRPVRGGQVRVLYVFHPLPASNTLPDLTTSIPKACPTPGYQLHVSGDGASSCINVMHDAQNCGVVRPSSCPRRYERRPRLTVTDRLGGECLPF